ncbi:MAG: hypothetical protein AB8B96_01250 [Lysobacterales bacterium]
MSLISPTTALIAFMGLVAIAGPGAMADEIQAGGDPAPVSNSAADLWNSYFIARELGERDEALALAMRLRDAVLAQHGAVSEDYGMALTEVGISRLLVGEHGPAFADLTAAEGLLKERLPLYSQKLIRAMTFLGAALHSQDRFEEALDAYSRAQHISHRIWGADNDTQIPITYAKAATLQALGSIEGADKQYGLGWKLNRKQFGVASPQAIAAAARYGTWLRSVGEYDAAISLFHDAISEVQADGVDQPIALPLLRGMAHAYRGGHRGKHARGMYQRIIRLMDREPGAFSVDQKMDVRLAFGDWLMQRYFEKPAVAQYEAAWVIARDAGPDGAHWLAQFEQPQLVRYGEMSPTDLTGDSEPVTFEYEITQDGRIKRPRVVESSASSRASSRARKRFPELTRFRPAVVDGQAQGEAVVTTTMFLLPAGVAIEPAPIAAPKRLTVGPTAGVAAWTLLRQDQVSSAEVAIKD